MSGGGSLINTYIVRRKISDIERAVQKHKSDTQLILNICLSSLKLYSGVKTALVTDGRFCKHYSQCNFPAVECVCTRIDVTVEYLLTQSDQILQSA